MLVSITSLSSCSFLSMKINPGCQEQPFRKGAGGQPWTGLFFFIVFSLRSWERKLSLNLNMLKSL